MADADQQSQGAALAQINTPLTTVAQVLDHPEVLESFTSVNLRNFVATTKAIIAIVNQRGKGAIQLALDEFGRRMRTSNTHIIPDQEYNIRLTDEFGEYTYDIEALREAAEKLPPHEAEKIITYVPEQIIPAHYEPGHWKSIATLQAQYENTEEGKLLNRGMSRPKLGQVVLFERHKAPKRPAQRRSA